MAMDDAGNAREATFNRVDTDRMMRQEAPLLAPLWDGCRTTAQNTERNSADCHLGKLTIDDERRSCGDSKPQPSEPPVNKDQTGRMAHDALMRAEYKTTVTEMLGAASNSDHVQKGEGYYQVLKRMDPGLRPDELYKLSNEIRAVNGNNHILHRGQQFELLSPEQKNAVLGNIMNDYDRAHGARGLKDAPLDPVLARMANGIRARVEQAAEPELAKSFDLPAPKPDEVPKPDAPADGPKPADCPKPDEIPFDEKVRLAVEACHDKYEDVDRAARLARTAAKLYSPESREYEWAMKSLSEGIKCEGNALNEFEKLVAQHPEDRKLTHEYQKDLAKFTKQQVRIMKELHTILS